VPNGSGSVHPVPCLAAQAAGKSLDLLDPVGIQRRFDIAPIVSYSASLAPLPSAFVAKRDQRRDQKRALLAIEPGNHF
jgi:hypothetical protein